MTRLVVCDLDNTLYDWVSYFVPAFYAMVDKAIEITNWDREELLDSFQTVHQRHGDSEHPYALLETEIVRKNYPEETPGELKERFQSAFDSFNAAREKRLRLFPDVLDTLVSVQNANIPLVAHSEAKFHAVVDRLRQLQLVEFFERVYCRERAEREHPDGVSDADWSDGMPMSRVFELSHHQRKPDTTVLLEICREMKVRPEDTVYIGDSISHDIMMANEAGVTSVFAKYGTERDPEEWDKLVRITHWTPEDVERELELRKKAEFVKADFVAESSFREILHAIDF